MPIIRMKTTLKTLLPGWIALLTMTTSGHAQCVTYKLGEKGDTLNCTDKKNHKQGPWIVHVDPLRGEPGYEEEGVYRDDVKDGVWKEYSLQGDMIAVENYRWGSKDGKQEYFTTVGDRLREESWMAVDPENPYDTVLVYDDPHNPFKSERKAIKFDVSTVKHGTWLYFDPSTGTVAKTEEYVLGKLKTGTISSSAAPKNDVDTRPKEVQDYEKKNSGKKTVKIRTGETGG